MILIMKYGNLKERFPRVGAGAEGRVEGINYGKNGKKWLIAYLWTTSRRELCVTDREEKELKSDMSLSNTSLLEITLETNKNSTHSCRV